MISVGASPRLREALPKLARGRVIAVDYFASARCGVVVGDITARFREPAADPGLARLPDLEGVPVLASPRLLPLLERTRLTIDRSWRPLGDGLTVSLDAPELWLDFLEEPGVLRAARRPPRLDRRAS